MELPKNIKLMGRIFEIKYPHKFKEDTQVGGLTFASNIIQLSGTHLEGACCADEVWSTLFHEILHWANRTFCTSKLTEDEVDVLAEFVLQIIVDNFGFVPEIESKAIKEQCLLCRFYHDVGQLCYIDNEPIGRAPRDYGCPKFSQR